MVLEGLDARIVGHNNAKQALVIALATVMMDLVEVVRDSYCPNLQMRECT